MSGESWDHEVDVLVVGSGNGGMTAALCAHEYGAGSVLLIEKNTAFGGTSAISGGGVWVPCNRYARAAGAQDSIAEARAYLEATIPASVPRAMIEAYLDSAPRMIDFLHERTRVRYRTLPQYPDYYSQLQGSKNGHRSMEPEPIAKSELREEAARLIDTHHMMWMFGRFAITQAEAHDFTVQLPGWWKRAAVLVLRAVLDLPWFLKWGRSRRICTGCAGVARLRLSMLDRGLPLLLGTPMRELLTDSSGRVCGVLAERDGRSIRIHARKAVILAAGGFEHNQAMREQYLPRPTEARWSGGVHTNTGDALRECIRLGAATRGLDEAWWCTTIAVPGESAPRLSIMEKSYPGSCVVNRAGRRFTNESQNYMAYQKELFARHSAEHPCVPSYHVFDARFRGTYIVGPLYNSRMRPDWLVPQRWFDEGFVHRADTIEELARKAGIDPAGLADTVRRMNEYARTGKDPDFGRGDAEYDRYYGDPRVTPNPCLAPIDQPPFYAMPIDPGDFGTSGGVVTDTNARVLRADGSAIEGLHAIGNCAAAVLPTYPGPGSTLGPAMTFAWRAARFVCGVDGESARA
jgi:3-oxosteroid 1-dehydrogenase